MKQVATSHKTPLISVIVPVHNAEIYLEECLVGIIGQTYANIEVIIIDDNSIDGSNKIIQEYKEKDKRVKCGAVKYNNAALTRAKGVQMATAPYVCFVDSDDIIHARYVESLYNALRTANTQISTGKISTFDTRPIDDSRNDTSHVGIEDDVIAFFGKFYHSNERSRYIAQSMGAKLFDKELFKGIDYSVIKTTILEDNYVMAQILKKARSEGVATVDSTIYYYRQNQNSTMGRALDTLIEYGTERLSYVELFEKTMNYISDLFGNNKKADYYLNQIRVHEYYNLASTIIGKNEQINTLASKLCELVQQNVTLAETAQAKEESLKNILSSKSYRIGHAILLPVRKIRGMLRLFRAN